MAYAAVLDELRMARPVKKTTSIRKAYEYDLPYFEYCVKGIPDQIEHVLPNIGCDPLVSWWNPHVLRYFDDMYTSFTFAATSPETIEYCMAYRMIISKQWLRLQAYVDGMVRRDTRLLRRELLYFLVVEFSKKKRLPKHIVMHVRDYLVV
jgi:hypothetical protein